VGRPSDRILSARDPLDRRAAVLVVAFMIFYYKASGIIADIALILNVVITLAALAIFRATLTLPGIAGLVLSVGMAVDANILIHERIKEELRWGRRSGPPSIRGITGLLRHL